MKVTRVGVAVGLVVFLTAMGGGASYALWSTAAMTSAQVKAATVAITVDGAVAASELSVPHQPGQSFTSALTIANSGSADVTYAIAVVPGTGGDLPHSSVAIALWKSASACTATSAIPAGAWAGTLAGLAAHGTEALAISASQALCVRTTLSNGVESSQQGDKAFAQLTFTGTNGWVDSKSVAISPSVYELPQVQFSSTPPPCSTNPQEMTMTLNWLSAGAGVTYRLEFSPAASSPVIVTTTELSASFTETSFTHTPGPGSITLRTIDANEWESEGTVMNITLADQGESKKLRC